MHSNLVAYHHSLFIPQGYQKWLHRRKRILSPNFSESTDPIPVEHACAKAAYTKEEICELVEAGFEYVCDYRGNKIFKKRK